MKEFMPPFILGFDKEDLAVHSFFVPKDPFSIFKLAKLANDLKSMGSTIKFNQITLEFLLLFQTNRVVCQQQSEVEKYKKYSMMQEYHFVRFEGQYKPLEVTLLDIKTKGWSKFQQEISKQFEIENWTITDFDGFLNGNPHIQ